MFVVVVTVILHELGAVCKRGRSQKDGNFGFYPGDILPKQIKTMQSLNFFSGKYDIFNVDTGWYNDRVPWYTMDYYVLQILT